MGQTSVEGLRGSNRLRPFRKIERIALTSTSMKQKHALRHINRQRLTSALSMQLLLAQVEHRCRERIAAARRLGRTWDR